MKSQKQKLLQYSRSLRTNMTDSEIILWRYLRRKQVLNIKFNRQKPIHNYVVDFFAAQIKLAIEIDGEQHFMDSGLQSDQKRDNIMEKLNIKVLRFKNIEIFKNLDEVLEEIQRHCEERLS